MRDQILSLALNSFETDSRVLRACRSLIAVGYAVKVAALHEGELPGRQSIGPLEVERIRLWTRGWPKWRPIQLIKFFEWVARVACRFHNYETIHCNDLNTLPAGVLIKLLSLGRARIIYDTHEFASNHKASQSRLSIATLQLIEGTLIRFADRVVTVSHGIAEEYSRLYPIDPPSVVMNCPRYQRPVNEDRFRKRFGIRPDQMIFLTQGWLRPNRGIESMLEAFSRMKDDGKVLVVMGRGHLDQLVQSYAERFPNIHHHPVVPPEDLLQHTASADYGIALIPGISFSYRHCLPNKLFEYIMAGLPVIVSDLPEMRRVTQEHDIGVVCKDVTPEALLEAIDVLMARDRTVLVRNVDAARQIFSWEAQERIWVDVVQRVGT